MRIFGKFAKERMTKAGRRQKDLAEQLKVSTAYVSQILTGHKNPPDLGKQKNKWQLPIWIDFLQTSEEEILGLIRYELHKIPLKPNPKFPKMRALLLKRINGADEDFEEEIKSLSLHPAENLIIRAMTQIYMMLQEEPDFSRAYGISKFKDFCSRAPSNRDFVEGELLDYFRDRTFSWSWDKVANDVALSSESGRIRSAMDKMAQVLEANPGVQIPSTVPIIASVSAGEGFAYTDGGYAAGEGFERVEMPPGINPGLARSLYCVRVRGDSLREFFSDGTLLFIKPESWEEIKDGDLVIFKDAKDRKAFVKKVEFSGDNLILKSMNPLYKNMVLSKWDLTLLERVMAIVL